MDNKIPIIVFSLMENGNILKAVMDGDIGTYVGR
jgi:uridylate kinase